MSKRRKRQQTYSIREHTVNIPQVGFVTLLASRESNKPFCAWYGPNGETCSSTTMLAIVATLAGIPPVGYMACPLHFDEVRQSKERFLVRFGLSLSDVDATGR